AEDGIRDFHVTGVQTCALPIFSIGFMERQNRRLDDGTIERVTAHLVEVSSVIAGAYGRAAVVTAVRAESDPSCTCGAASRAEQRSEERRVGKEGRARRAA